MRLRAEVTFLSLCGGLLLVFRDLCSPINEVATSVDRALISIIALFRLD